MLGVREEMQAWHLLVHMADMHGDLHPQEASPQGGGLVPNMYPLDMNNTIFTPFPVPLCANGCSKRFDM